MEYIYIIAIIGYYIYKVYAGAKKEEETNAKKRQAQSPSHSEPAPKKKSMIEHILEEIEKANQENQKTTQPHSQPVPTVQTRKPVQDRKRIQQPFSSQKPSPKKELTTLGQIHKMSDTETAVRKTFVIPQEQAPKEVRRKKRFAGMNMSPREAVIAQIILERKF